MRTTTSFTTDDGTGSGGTTLDAPPGKVLIAATLAIVNNSGRQEPFLFPGTGPLPQLDTTFPFGIPKGDLAAFGIPDTDVNHSMFCTGANVPTGYCTLSGQVGGFSPASDDSNLPQLAPGATATLTILPFGLGGASGQPIPEGAPLKDLKVFAERTVGCDVSDPACAVALN
ncbi:hypothetical protein SPF06_14840 [Sinomonas sp. JGH33]|uniref:Uncharacterized protein n=1 Tax=Sinomonas terricola TaxID=3110330 RepID=A0ABU5T8P0_9MICC|nr:hypothetical protein [Sinomonas sp. JGH33]MEA5456010.1 hypothetical protein [Sinomonas sp. JGH33]